MHLLNVAVLYTALLFGANAAAAEADLAKLGALRVGDMQKLILAAEPEAIDDPVLIDEADAEHRLSDKRGKYLLVNFWATWCAPCRAELASLDKLQADLGGDRFEVVTVATGRNPLPAIDKLFAEIGVTRLPKWRDPDQSLARGLGIFALPVSVLVDPEGREIGRLMGDAVWDGPEAMALIGALIAPAP
jgi:thiol-disulfide isomerase/thioredoxin